LGGAIAAMAAFLLATHGAPSRFPPQVRDFDAAMSVRFQCPPADQVPFGGIDGCLIGAPGENPARADAVLFGNSHAEMYAPAVEPILARRGLKGLMVSTGGCLPITAFNTSHECIALMRKAIEAVARLPDAKIVIIGSTWPRDVRLVDASGGQVPTPSWPQYLVAVQQTLDAFARAGKHVILIGPAPWPGYNSTSVAARELLFRGRIETPLAQSRAAYDARFAPLEQWLGTLEPGVTIVRPSALMCDRARCSFRLGGKPAYFDDNHLSVFVMPAFEPSFDQALDKALPPSKRGV